MNLKLLFPSAQELYSALLNYHDMFLTAWKETAMVSILACVISLLLSLLVSITSTRFPRFGTPVNIVVAISQSFPLQAIAPLLVVVLGHGTMPKLTVATIITFFPLYAVCSNALQSTPESLLHYGKLTGAGYFAQLWHIRLPAALPAICGATKIAFTLSVLGTVVAEFISPNNGIGRLLILSQSQFNIENMYICIAILAFQGLLIYTILGMMEKQLIKSRRF